MNEKTEKQIEEIHAVIVNGEIVNPRLRAAARAVVDARYYNGDDGWDRLENAIGELEAMVGRSDMMP